MLLGVLQQQQTYSSPTAKREHRAAVLQIEARQDDNATLAYWLTNTVTLLYMLQRNIKPASSAGYNAGRGRSPAGASRWEAARMQNALACCSAAVSDTCRAQALA